jgi:NitT/TauT family transport system ATP-binding protein
MILQVDHVSHWFGKKRVLNDINLQVSDGQFVALVGPSGCGKSTLLRSILGTHPAAQGSIIVDGDKIVGPTRKVGIVYQNYSLFPFLTIEENVAFGLKLDQTSILGRLNIFKWWPLRKQHLQAARELLIEFGLENCLTKYPDQCSGGQRQRAAIAQALIMKPDVLLLDEPYGALDEASRETQHDVLLRLYAKNIEAKKDGHRPPLTVVLITHELKEAFYVCDRVVGLGQYWSKLAPDGVTTLYGKDMGATIMFDKAAPTFRPDEPNDVARYDDLKSLLRATVFEENEYQNPDENVTFWSDLENGNSTGVSATAVEQER